MWTGLCGCHSPARPAVKRVVKKQRRNSELRRIKLVKDVVRVIGPVVVANTSVIATNNEMRAAVVLTDQGMKDSLAWSCIAHRCWHHGQNSSCSGVVLRENLFVRTHSDISRHIVQFGVADERMKQKTIGNLECAFLNVFMCAMYGIARLKRNDA